MGEDYSQNFATAMTGHNGLDKKAKPAEEAGPGGPKATTNVGQLPKPEKPFSGKLQSFDPNKPLDLPTDEKDYQNYTNNFAKKYAAEDKFGFVKDRADWGLFLNTESDETRQPVKNAVMDSSKRLGIRPELLFASAMEEGMRKALPKKEGDQVDFSGNDKYPVYGFKDFGLDDFGTQFQDLVKKGLLPENFKDKFVPNKEKNEKGREVLSANFKTVDDALEAKAAVIKDASNKLDSYTKEKNLNLSPAAKEFFTLAYFNAGEDGAKQMIESWQKKGLLDGDKFLKEKPPSWSGAWENVMKRIVMANALQKEKAFEK